MRADALAGQSAEALARDRAATREYRPTILCTNQPDHLAALRSLLQSGRVLFLHDTLDAQLEELVETRSPEQKLSRDEVLRRASALSGGAPSSYGCWVYYPWSGRAAHVLPEDAYAELRTSRNRNKITREEQDRLSGFRIGVVGLSVGQSTAVTLALEGVGGSFRLADFDDLSLSNMNRLRGGVHEIGVNKAVLAAREIYEINPYAKVEVFERGVSEATLEAFFSDSEPLDLLIEECDDLKMKFLLRGEARRRRIPVIMETSDRGLFDVERFDHDPHRALFHGLVPELDPASLSGMTTTEKVPILLDMIGLETMSRRAAASLIDIESTLKTWPQLASAVGLGGAINTDAARRILLGGLTRSGRFFVDLERIVADDVAQDPATERETTAEESARLRAGDAARPEAGEATPLHLGADEPVSGPVIEEILRLATLAPSGGNCQPWRFTYRAGLLRSWHDRPRSRSFLDHQHVATYVAFGALAENFRLAATGAGVGHTLQAFPEPGTPALVWEARLGVRCEPLGPDDALLRDQIEARTTNRRTGPPSVLPPEAAASLVALAEASGARLKLVSDRRELDELGVVLGRADRLRFLSPIMHAEVMRELRWSAAEARRSRDGLDIDTLELNAADRGAMRLIADRTVIAALRRIGGGDGLGRLARKQVASASALALMTVDWEPDHRPMKAITYFRGGQAFQRVWLLATKLGLAVQPMTALIYLLARLDAGGEGLEAEERHELGELRDRFHAIFGDRTRESAEVVLFRVAVAPPPNARSLRRSPRETISILR